MPALMPFAIPQPQPQPQPQPLPLPVTALARHYAWSERDILTMSPIRRRFYLDLVRA